jgi:hypothetical protein
MCERGLTVTFRRLRVLKGEEKMMVYPTKVTELKRLSPHANIVVRPVRPTPALGLPADAR